MTRFFVILTLSSLLLISETEGFPKNIKLCVTDDDCDLESFCYSSEVATRFCIPCNSCSENFMRSNGDVKCPRSGYECGACLSGFAAEELSSGDMSESCRPIKQEKLAKLEEPNPETPDRLISGFLIAIGLTLIAVALFCLASYTRTLNTFPENRSQVVPSAPSIQTVYEKQPANNPKLGLYTLETGLTLTSIHPKFERFQRAEPFFTDSIEIDQIQPSSPSMPLSPAESNATEPSTWTPFNDESLSNDGLSNEESVFNQESVECPSGSNIQEFFEDSPSSNYGRSNYGGHINPSQPQGNGRAGPDDQAMIKTNGYSLNNYKRRKLN